MKLTEVVGNGLNGGNKWWICGADGKGKVWD